MNEDQIREIVRGADEQNQDQEEELQDIVEAIIQHEDADLQQENAVGLLGVIEDAVAQLPPFDAEYIDDLPEEDRADAVEELRAARRQEYEDAIVQAIQGYLALRNVP